MIRKELIISALICITALFASCKSPGGGGMDGGGGGGPMGGGGCKKCQNPNRDIARDEQGNVIPPDDQLIGDDGRGLAGGDGGIFDPSGIGGATRPADPLLQEPGATPIGEGQLPALPGGSSPSATPDVAGAGAGAGGGATIDPVATGSVPTNPSPTGSRPQSPTP